MKILAIRGRNLASLGGDWEIRFDSGPLLRAGTFAICGPTGAGKSTIFDALCLALFGRTPRYGSGGHLVGAIGVEEEDKLRSGDPRGILRRGTGEGFAQVEFAGSDGRNYRASWKVWRAGKTARGRMQNASHTVMDIMLDRVVASGVTAVGEFIGEKLGLTLDQFTRAVLLPQGDFANFLKAPASERAALLEKVTDSSIYGRIGMIAFEKARVAQTAYSTKAAEQSGIVVFTDEERGEEEQRRAEGEAAVVRARGARDAARTEHAWFAKHAELNGLVEQARAALVAPEKAYEAASDRRVVIAAIEEAEPYRAAVEGARTAAAEAEAADDNVRRARTALASATTTAEAEGKAAAAAVARAAAAKAARVEAEPKLQAARASDERVRAFDDALTKADAAADRRKAELAAAMGALSAASSRLEADNAKLKKVGEWLAERPQLAGLSAGWTLAEARLHTFAKAKNEGERLAAARPALESAVSAAGILSLDRAAAAKAAETRLAAAAEQRAAAARVVDGLPDSTPLRAALAADQQALTRWTTLAERYQTLAAEEAVLRAEASAAAGLATAHRQAAAAGAADVLNTTPRLDEAKEMRHRTGLTVEMSEHRPTLVDGTACPLCGATDHPYASREPDTDGILATLDARIKELEAQLRASQSRVDSETAKASAQDERARRADENAVKKGAERGALLGSWTTAGRSREPSTVVLADEAAAIVVREAALAAAEKSAKAATEAVKRADLAEREARSSREKAVVEAGEAARGLEAAERTRTEADAARTRVSAQIEETLRELGPAFTGWPMWEARLHADPSGFTQQCAAEVSNYQTNMRDVAALTLTITKLNAEVEGFTLAAAEKETALAAATTEARQARAQRDSEKKAREAMLNGEAAAAFEARLKAAETLAETEATGTASRAADAQRVLAEWSGKVTEADSVAAARRALAEASAKERDERLRAAGLVQADVEARLGADAGWVRHERAELDALRTAVDTAKRVLAGRDGDLMAHEGTTRPSGTADEARGVLTNAEAALEAATSSLGALTERLRTDDENRVRRGAFEDELAALGGTRDRWERLSQLIGDSAGKKFKIFAQSITLDLLVSHANVHLAKLAPRYRLQRVPLAELELQVIDGDSADDVRSLSSLSGGETFLASLALALGLSSIVTKNLHIGSLFIDEGFGTLDAATLATAVSVLESLHATGRQVGVISHVDGLAEQLGAWVSVEKETATKSIVRVGSGRRDVRG